MRKIGSIESFFMGVMGFGLFLFVGLSFAFMGPRHVQAGHAVVAGEVACAPAQAHQNAS
jgi:hypothetical protein